VNAAEEATLGGGASTSAFWREARRVDRPIGESGRSWYPYELRSELRAAARKLGDPIESYRELLAREEDPVWREALLFLVAATDDPRADDVLVDALRDPALRPRALYLLGVVGTKGWPSRDRDVKKVLRAILPYVDDTVTYRDVYYGDEAEVGDLARGAFVRVAGPERFPAVRDLAKEKATWIGLALPALDARERAALSRDVRAYARSELRERG
jgi:hypothetical protein